MDILTTGSAAVLVTSVVVTFAVSTIKQSHWSNRIKTLVAIGLSLVGGAAVVGVSGEYALDTHDLAGLGTAVYASSSIIYNLIIKNTGLNAKLEAVNLFGPNKGEE